MANEEIMRNVIRYNAMNGKSNEKIWNEGHDMTIDMASVSLIGCVYGFNLDSSHCLERAPMVL